MGFFSHDSDYFCLAYWYVRIILLVSNKAQGHSSLSKQWTLLAQIIEKCYARFGFRCSFV